jgi:ATP-dependent protease ClpP protease subunit
MHTKYVDFDKRQVILVGEVSAEMFLTALSGSRILTQDADGILAPITFLINTDGGDVAQALAIHELISALPMPTRTHAVGACMSSGMLILQAGKVRSASPSCSLMVHFGEEMNTSGSEAKHNAEFTRRMKVLFRERTGRSAKAVNGWFDGDTFFTAEEALKAKLIDEVII